MMKVYKRKLSKVSMKLISDNSAKDDHGYMLAPPKNNGVGAPSIADYNNGFAFHYGLHRKGQIMQVNFVWGE
jgi:hypothetical protein